MDIDNLTVGEAKKIAAMFLGEQPIRPRGHAGHEKRPVIVCTDKRSVVFGYTHDVTERPIRLESARMCLYWSADVGGVFGLGEIGPTTDCRVSAPLADLLLEGVTAVFGVDSKAEKAWTSAKIQGR